MSENTNRMKLTVTVDIEVNTEGWALDYGIGGEEEIREDVNSFLLNALQTINENITVPGPSVMTVTATKGQGTEPHQMDTNLDVAAEVASLTYTMTRSVHQAGDKTWTGDTFIFSDGEVWEIVSESTLNPSGNIDKGPVTATKSGKSAHAHEFHAKLATARAADEQPEPPMTYLLDHSSGTNGSKHWDNDVYTFSDGQVWEVISEWTQNDSGVTDKTVTETCVWVDGRVMAAVHADFLAKFATAVLKIN